MQLILWNDLIFEISGLYAFSGDGAHGRSNRNGAVGCQFCSFLVLIKPVIKILNSNAARHL
jgi:hypothetical protein